MYRLLTTLFILALFLAACTAPVSTAPALITESSTSDTPGDDLPDPFPEPTGTKVPRNFTPNPAPATSDPISPDIPVAGYEPQPGDYKLSRDEAYLKMEYTSLAIRKGFPVEVEVSLNGILPDPCHQLRVVVREDIENQAINLEVYSVVDPSQACITVVAPYEVTIPLGSYTEGEFLVYVNEAVLGEFGIEYSPRPGDEQMRRDQVFLELEKSLISVTGTQPVQVSVLLVGNLPDPCHHLRVVNPGPDADHKIDLEVYSLVPTGVRCITVIKSFQAIIPLGTLTTGHYTIRVNSENLGEFDR